MPHVGQDLVLRVGGDSAAGGIVATGEIFAYMAAWAGLEVYTTRTIPAEIKGGHVMYQMRAALEPLTAQGDELDVLLAYDEETFERYYKMLKPEGLLVFNSNDLQVETTGHRHRRIGVPMHDIAKSLNFARGYNMVAVGALVKLFDMDMDIAIQSVTKRLGHGRAAESLAVNLDALQKGFEYIEQAVGKEPPFHLPLPKEKRAERIIVSGNQALAMGVIASGCRFMAGYPITPASEIMEFLAAEFPHIGGTMIQAEDEIAACGMAVGGSFTGQRAMTATSGPGLALMIEMISHASMTETPLLVVDVQRVGPSTGMPTKVSQGDLRLACYGGNDDSPRFVVAATSVEDCFYIVPHAFNLTELYQAPVIVLSDQDMAVRVQTVAPFDVSKVKNESRLVWDPKAANGAGYERYVDTPNGVSAMSIPGQAGGQYTAEGLEHFPSGAPAFSAELHAKNMRKRARKLEAAVEYVEKNELWEEFGDPSSTIGILGWGSVIGPVREAVIDLATEGIKVHALFPKVIQPLPEHKLAEFLKGKQERLVTEMNFSGQFAEMLQAKYLIPFTHVNSYSGVPFLTSEIMAAIREAHARLK
ncbi:MAG: 2-oxoacid:acceptor oxidoreductase subunit alpha [Chloroflexi bacterium]|nr:2-oxoacid:acceptor oxidoreductase subunit alpha [Chloroflexota bacterium]